LHPQIFAIRNHQKFAKVNHHFSEKRPALQEEKVKLKKMTTKQKKIYMWYKVRELISEGLNKSQVSRQLGLDRATVRRYLTISEQDFINQLEAGRTLPLKLGMYLKHVKNELIEFPYLSAAQIEDRLKERYADLPKVHSKTVYNFVQMVRGKYGIEKPKGLKERIFEQLPECDYGSQGQVDFGECNMPTKAGKRVKVYFFTMVLSRSRYKYVYFQNTPFTTATTIYAHHLAFEYFGGIPKEIWYDQDSVFIKDENLGDYLLTHEFKAFSEHQPFKVVFCRKADPQSKGKVENVVKYVKNNFVKGRYYENPTALNQLVLAWLSRTGNAKRHGTTHKIPAQEWEMEKQYLLPYKEKPKKPENQYRSYNVRKDNTLAYRGNFYSLPLGTYEGRKTTILLSELCGTLSIYTMNQELITTHTLSLGRGESIRNTDHRRNKSKTMDQKHTEMFQLLGGDKKAQLYLDLLRQDKTRYYYDNLRVILEKTKTINKEFIQKSLVFCLENKLYNGHGFCEVAQKYQKESTAKNHQQIDQSTANNPDIINQQDLQVQTSDIDNYEKLFDGWNK
jgi:transposase